MNVAIVVRAAALLAGLAMAPAPLLAQDAGVFQFGDDAGAHVGNRICEDPRFIGRGAAEQPLAAAEMHDARDCSLLFLLGQVEIAVDDRSLHPEGPLSILERLEIISKGGGKSGAASFN